MIRHLLSYIWLLCLLTPATVAAQKLPMTVDLQQLTQAPRGEGPITLVWQCSVASTGLLEGYFLVTAHDGVEKFGQFRSNDVALHAGYHEIPMMLPPMKADNNFSNVSLKVSFVTPKKRYDLKNEYLLRVGRRQLRTFAVGLCDPFDLKLPIALNKFLDELDFEAISPPDPLPLNLRGYQTTGPLRQDVKTFSISVPPHKFPQLPLDCHQFDILVLTPRALELMETRHLRPILQWVRSGGSLCVLCGENLKPTQVQFLNQLSDDEAGTPFVLNSTGKLELAENQVWFYRTGWGRTVILSGEALEQDSLSKTQRSRIPFFLWKLRQSQRDFYAKNQIWDFDILLNNYKEFVKQNRNRYGEAYAINDLFSMNYRPIDTGGAVVSNLMPDQLRIVPAWLIMLILLCYVVVIGPGEYIILGRFNLRRYTWITFPLLSIGFALIAFLISNFYMQTSHERKSLTVIDLDSRGRRVRENQIELLFTGSYQDVETPVKSGLLTPLNQLELGMGQDYYRYSRGMDASLVGAPYYDGTIPTQYSVYQRMPQWTPQLNRIISNYPQPAADDGFDWSTVRAEQLVSEQGRAQLRQKIEQALGREALLFIYRGNTKGNVKKYPTNHQQVQRNRNQLYFSSKYALFNSTLVSASPYAMNQQSPHSFMDDLCVRNQQGLFQVVSQVSPAGGSNYEDLSILDPSDPRQWLVVVYVPGQTGNTLYRKLLYSENPNSDQSL